MPKETHDQIVALLTQMHLRYKMKQIIRDYPGEFCSIVANTCDQVMQMFCEISGLPFNRPQEERAMAFVHWVCVDHELN